MYATLLPARFIKCHDDLVLGRDDVWLPRDFLQKAPTHLRLPDCAHDEGIGIPEYWACIVAYHHTVALAAT